MIVFYLFPASNPESKECPYSGKYVIEKNQHSRSVRSVKQAPINHKTKPEEEIPEHNRRVNNTRLFNYSVRNMSDAPMLRSKRQTDEGEVSCVVNNYNRLEVGCNSVKNMEFYSTCDNREYITGELCYMVYSKIQFQLNSSI